MAEPSADGIDVDARTKKVCRGRVADGVRADPFLAHVRHTAHGDVRISRNDLMDAEACERLRVTIEEHSFRTAPPDDEVFQRSGCRSP